MICFKRCRCGGEMEALWQRLPDGQRAPLLVCRKCALALSAREWWRGRVWEALWLLLPLVVAAALVYVVARWPR